MILGFRDLQFVVVPFSPGRAIIRREWRPPPSILPKGILPLDQLRPLCKDEDWPFEPGIYFLWRGPLLAYVGMSKYLSDRINCHISVQHGLYRGKVIPFDRISWIVCREQEMTQLEARYIRTYLPPYNDKIPPCY